MREKALVLERTILADLAAIDELFATLAATPFSGDESPKDLVYTAYHLHNLYSAFENIFLAIARTFENQIDADAGWHRQLLERMMLDLSPLRPAVIDRHAFEALDELRRFRHLFRAAYGVTFHPDRLELVRRQAATLGQIHRPQIDRFLAFLRALDGADPG